MKLAIIAFLVIIAIAAVSWLLSGLLDFTDEKIEDEFTCPKCGQEYRAHGGLCRCMNIKAKEGKDA